MLELDTPAGSPPRDLLDEALRETFGQIAITASSGGRPPQLRPSITAARIAQEMDDVDDLVAALRNIAHAAIAAIVRVRACADHAPPAAPPASWAA
ncbi:MAG: hypothetical protein QOG15_1635 [Solirubrobacteraceae bacterium]|jgi:hypothetical protein|nr:hypothetical protein [Solirubrobacteraceae bacterium]